MRNFHKALAVGATALLASAFHGSTFAQAPNAQPGAAVQFNANAQADDQQNTRQLITHALNMAINGSDLQFTAQTQGRRRQGDAQGENRDRNQNADNRNENNANNNNANADNRRDGEQDRQAHQQAIQQLRQLAWRQFENGNGLLHDADASLSAEGNNAANSRDERGAWTRRLHTAANQYATTLRTLSGVGSRAPEASATGDADDQNNRDRDRDRDQAGANQNQNQNRRSGSDQNAGNGWLNRTEAAQVALLNQAVRESIEAFELNQSHHHHAYGVNRAVQVSALAQRLQGHARQMAADSEKIIQQVQASLNREGGRADQNRDQNQNQNQNRRDDQDQNDRQNNARNQGDNNGQQGRASVQLLASQARQVVETLQRIESAEGAVVAPAR